jgi:DNA-binding MarR family transcriptional regulator
MHSDIPKKHADFFGKNSIMIDHIAHIAQYRQNEKMLEHGITNKQSRMLMHIIFCDDRPISQRDIENEFSLSSSTVTSIITNLEKGGFVERHPSSTDARVNHLTVTQRGYGLRNDIIQIISSVDDELTEGFTESEKAQLHNMLERMIENMHKYRPARPDRKKVFD